MSRVLPVSPGPAPHHAALASRGARAPARQPGTACPARQPGTACPATPTVAM
jgi:hypothetical protein